MGKKDFAAAIFVSLIVASLIAGMRAVEVARANWVIAPTKPITDAPTLIVQSPINNCSYLEAPVPLNVTVTKPGSWGPSDDPSIYHDCGISYIHYVLDGASYSLFQAQLINPVPQDLLPAVSNFSESLKGLTEGAHSLQVVLYALSQWCPDNSGPYGTSIPPFYYYNMTVTSETIHFNVGPQATLSQPPMQTPIPSPSTSPTRTPIPSPTTPSSTPETSPTQQPAQTPNTISGDTPSKAPDLTPHNTKADFTSLAVIIGAPIALVAIIGSWAFAAKRRRWNK